MANMKSFTIEFTVDELRAVFEALGNMTGEKYDDAILAQAGSTVYSTITPFADEENWI